MSKETIEDEKAVVEYFEKPIEDPIQLEKLISDIEAESKADKALIKASQLTGQVAASILLNKPCPQSYIEEHKKAKETRDSTAIICAMAATLSLPLAYLNAAFTAIVLLATMIAYAVVEAAYREAKKRVEWYSA